MRFTGTISAQKKKKKKKKKTANKDWLSLIFVTTGLSEIVFDQS